MNRRISIFRALHDQPILVLEFSFDPKFSSAAFLKIPDHVYARFRRQILDKDLEKNMADILEKMLIIRSMMKWN